VFLEPPVEAALAASASVFRHSTPRSTRLVTDRGDGFLDDATLNGAATGSLGIDPVVPMIAHHQGASSFITRLTEVKIVTGNAFTVMPTSFPVCALLNSDPGSTPCVADWVVGQEAGGVADIFVQLNDPSTSQLKTHELKSIPVSKTIVFDPVPALVLTPQEITAMAMRGHKFVFDKPRDNLASFQSLPEADFDGLELLSNTAGMLTALRRG